MAFFPGEKEISETISRTRRRSVASLCCNTMRIAHSLIFLTKLVPELLAPGWSCPEIVVLEIGFSVEYLVDSPC